MSVHRLRPPPVSAEEYCYRHAKFEAALESLERTAQSYGLTHDEFADLYKRMRDVEQKRSRVVAAWVAASGETAA